MHRPSGPRDEEISRCISERCEPSYTQIRRPTGRRFPHARNYTPRLHPEYSQYSQGRWGPTGTTVLYHAQFEHANLRLMYGLAGESVDLHSVLNLTRRAALASLRPASASGLCAAG
jgi:hypothetical protein